MGLVILKIERVSWIHISRFGKFKYFFRPGPGSVEYLDLDPTRIRRVQKYGIQIRQNGPGSMDLGRVQDPMLSLFPGIIFEFIETNCTSNVLSACYLQLIF